MKINYTEFCCDECSNRVVNTPAQIESFPYSRGWLYLYEINFKTKKSQIVQKKDKHFCSLRCMTEYLHILITASDNEGSDCIGLFKNQKD